MNTQFSHADICDPYLLIPGAGAQYAMPGLLSFGGSSRYCGPIVTVKAEKGIAVRLKNILSQPGPWRALVVDNGAYSGWSVSGGRLARKKSSESKVQSN